MSKVGQAVLARLMESQVWHSPAGSVYLLGEGSKKGQCSLPSFYLGESYPPALALMPDTLVPPCMLLVPFKLLPQCWSSEGVSLNKSMGGFFRGNCFGLQRFPPLTKFPLVFVARSYGDLFSWTWNPGQGSWSGTETSCS